MSAIISVTHLSKTYSGGHQALKDLNLEIQRGEILALLGPNGAGKTTLISIICGLVQATGGTVMVDGQDIVSQYRITRSRIGLVPQELTLGAFDTVINTLRFSRGLFGKNADPDYLEQLLKTLSLWDKRDNAILTLSGGMKRRVLIGKALSHEPDILFLDEPTAGVDVELRKDMWALVHRLRETGVTVILTTHYIEEAEEIADRVGIINKGELLLVDNKQSIMHQLGKKQLSIHLKQAFDTIPESLAAWSLDSSPKKNRLIYTYDPKNRETDISALLDAVQQSGLTIKDINTSQTSLEDIFVDLVKQA